MFPVLFVLLWWSWLDVLIFKVFFFKGVFANKLPCIPRQMGSKEVAIEINVIGWEGLDSDNEFQFLSPVIHHFYLWTFHKQQVLLFEHCQRATRKDRLFWWQTPTDLTYRNANNANGANPALLLRLQFYYGDNMMHRFAFSSEIFIAFVSLLLMNASAEGMLLLSLKHAIIRLLFWSFQERGPISLLTL